jgi:Fur family ferric uptake transcriptional regulator
MRVGDDHHHLVCRECGAISDIAPIAESARCIDPGRAGAFEVDQMEITFWGRCPGYQEQTGGDQ